MRLPVRSTAQIQTTQARNTTRATPDAFGAAVGQGMRGVAQGLDQMEARRQQMEEEQAAADARLAYARLNDSLRERRTEYLSTSGVNARDGWEQYQQDVDRIHQEVAAGLSPRAREAYEPLALRAQNGALDRGAAHAAAERRNLEDQSYAAIVATQSDEATEAYASPQQHNDAVAIGVQQINDQAQRRGWTEERRQQTVREYRSSIGSTAISMALDAGDVERAEALRDQYADDFTAGDRAAVESYLSGERRIRERQEAVDSVFRQFGTNTNAGFAYIYENFSGEQEDAIAADYQRRVSRRQVETADAEAQIFDEVVAGFESGQYQSLADVPIRHLEVIGARRESLIERRFIEGNSDYNDRTDFDFVENIVWRAENAPDTLAEMNPLDFREYVATEQEYQQLRDYWRAAADPSRETPEPPSFLTNYQALHAAARAANIDLETAEGREFAQTAQRRLDRETARKGSDLLSSERDEVLNDVLREHILTQQTWRGAQTNFVSRGNLGEAFAGVPAHHADVLITVFGGAVDDDETAQGVREVYDRVVRDLSSIPGYDLSGLAGANALQEELELAREEMELAAEQAALERALAAEDEAPEPDGAAGESEAPREASRRRGFEFANLVGAAREAGRMIAETSERSLSSTREGLGLGGESAVEEETAIRQSLRELGYPQSEINRLARPFNRLRAERLIRQGVRYEGNR